MRRATGACLGLLVLASTAATGCFVSRKEVVREVPASTTTVERRSSVQTIPDADVVHRETTVERTY